MQPSGRNWIRRTLVGGLALAVMAGFAQAQTLPSPSRQSGVWKVSCAQAQADSCQMVQYAALRLGEPPLFLMTVTTEMKTGRRFGVVTAPLRVYLAPGIRIAVDGKRPFKALFELCDEAGCHAGFRLDGTVLDAFRKGHTARVTVWTAKDKAVVFPVSLDGFSSALQALDSRTPQ